MLVVQCYNMAMPSNYRSGGTRLYCFSPLVMLATFIIELAMALFVLWRYRGLSLSRIVLAILVLLATFQLAEYFACSGPESMSTTWSRIGFVAITMLPALVLQLASRLSGKRHVVVNGVF